MSDIKENRANPGAEGVKRKKKRSANQMAKKRARRKDVLGNELEVETYQYMCRIMDVLRTEFADTAFEDKLIFAVNVHEQTIGREVELAKNQVGSLVLDMLMKYIDLKAIQRLIDAFSPALRPLCNDKFASHVVERIIQVCADRGNRKLQSTPNTTSEVEEKVKIEDHEISKYNELALKLCRYVINNYEEFMWDLYSNGVMKTAIQCLGGLVDRDTEVGRRQPTPTFGPRREVIQEYSDLLTDASNRLMKMPQIIEFGKNELTSILLQTFIYTLKDVNPKLNSTFIKKVKDDMFTESTEETVSTIFENESSVRLLEVCLRSANEKIFKKLYKKFFVGQMEYLATNSIPNYAVQELINCCPTKELFESIFDALSEHFPKILENARFAIISNTANACLRLQAKQGPFTSLIAKTLDCEEPVERQNHLVQLITRLVTWEQFQNAKSGEREIPLLIYGSLTVQDMLRFNKPIKIITSILSMDHSELANLCIDPKGSRIIDAFMDSKFVGEKSRDKLAKQLKGHWTQLASCTHGSRCLEKIWQYSKNNQKYHIMDELAAVGGSLTSTRTGSILSSKLNVPLYARNKKDWEEAAGKEEKTKALFASIIGTDDKKSIKA